MIQREGQSDFVDSLQIGKRGTILKTAGTIGGPGVPDGTGPMKDSPQCPFSEEKQDDAGVDTPAEAKIVLKKFDKSPDVPNEYIDEHVKRITDGEDAKTVITDFFKSLQQAKESKSQLSIKTAKSLRQCGIFKKAERDVYQDAETGDFWKISEDGKNVVRMFKEIEGVADI